MFNSTSVENSNDCILKVDSGASDHYIKSDHMTYLNQVMKIQLPTTPINLPNNTTLHPSHTGVSAKLGEPKSRNICTNFYFLS